MQSLSKLAAMAAITAMGFGSATEHLGSSNDPQLAQTQVHPNKGLAAERQASIKQLASMSKKQTKDEASIAKDEAKLKI